MPTELESPPGREHQDVRKGWEDRQQEHGNRPRAVLMKGLHPLINESIDLWHRDVMRAVFAGDSAPPEKALFLDVGCGFGRLASEISRLGHVPIGVDFTHQFCVGFADSHGSAVCGDQAALPFADSTFAGAYSVTSLMYLGTDQARDALIELDRCLMKHGIALLLEPGREFNTLVRKVLPGKGRDHLAMSGFTLREMDDLLPPNWSVVASGDCRWLTFSLPLLAGVTRWPALYRHIFKLARHLDKPSNIGRNAGRLTMYRWIACRKTR